MSLGRTASRPTSAPCDSLPISFTRASLPHFREVKEIENVREIGRMKRLWTDEHGPLDVMPM